MSLRFTGHLEGWQSKPDIYTVAYIKPFLLALVQVNEFYLKTHPGTPKLYESGVVYQREHGSEIWRDIPAILKAGNGDCEDLACYLAAELRLQGQPADPIISVLDRPDDRGRLFHITVGVGANIRHDPSRKLGM